MRTLTTVLAVAVLSTQTAVIGAEFDPLAFADPFWGNGAIADLKSEGMARGWSWEKAQTGNTHPGAVCPFGWVSVCAYSGAYSTGYGRNGCSSDGPAPELYDRKAAFGFTHFHNSGTGWIGMFYNYFLFTPFLRGRDVTQVSDLADERAEPGYYAATLVDYGTSFEVTAAPQAACHRYRFSGNGGVVRIDTTAAGLSRSIGVRNYAERINWGDVKKVSPHCWCGYNFIHGVNLRFALCVRGQVVSSKNNAGVIELVFEGETAETAIGFSLLSAAEARSRVEDAFTRGFDAVRANARERWRETLGGIRARFSSEWESRAFYGALYQSCIKPCDYGGGFVDFSTLWDVYRTELPLVMAVSPVRARQIAVFMLDMILNNGKFPIQYSMSSKMDASSEQATSLAVYTLADAFFRGLFDVSDYPRLKRAFEAELDGVCLENRSSSFVLDYVGACGAAAGVAKACGDTVFANDLQRRGAVWKRVYDGQSGLLKAKGPYYEGDHRNYSFRPHPFMNERVELAGGQARFAALLDDFFCVGYEPDPAAPAQPCRRKGIADYMPEFSKDRPLRPGYFEGLCNETDMDAPYSYLWCGRADRLAEVLSLVRRCRFAAGEGGCPGNNDAGALGSWYVWSCLGLYPMTGSPYFLLGSPSVDSAELSVTRGVLKVRVERESVDAIYPVSYAFNGKTFTTPWLPVKDFEQGGELVFSLSKRPLSGTPVPDWM